MNTYFYLIAAFLDYYKITTRYVKKMRKYAKVYVSILNPKSVEETMKGLKESAGFIRSQVAKTVNLRITPELVFEYDDSIEHGEKIDNILKQISIQDKELKEKFNK